MVHVNTKSNDGAIKHVAQNEGVKSDFTEFCIVDNYSVSRGLDIYATAKNMDMLALSIPRRRFWERLFHQSTVKKFALHTKTPLIAIHG